MELRTYYLMSIPGVLKILEIVFSFVGLLMSLIHKGWMYTPYFTGTLVALIVALVIIMLYVLNLSETLGPIMSLQTYFHLVWMLYMMGYSSILLNSANSEFEWVTAGIFGILLAVTYLIDALHAFKISPPIPFNK